MFCVRKLIALIALLVAVPTTALAARSASWRTLPPPPRAASESLTGVWTWRQLILLGRAPLGGTPSPAKDVAEAYDPAAKRWTLLSPPAGADYVPGYKTVWTGKEMLAFDPFHSVAYRPSTNTWRVLRKSINLGLVAWT